MLGPRNSHTPARLFFGLLVFSKPIPYHIVPYLLVSSSSTSLSTIEAVVLHSTAVPYVQEMTDGNSRRYVVIEASKRQTLLLNTDGFAGSTILHSTCFVLF